MENRLPSSSRLALPSSAREDAMLLRASERTALCSWLQLPCGWRPLHGWMRLITGGPFPWAFFLSLPLVCPTPAEKWTGGLLCSQPFPLPLAGHWALTLDTVTCLGEASAQGF